MDRSMTKSKIKIYGERNTGSRYLGSLVGLNLAAELLRGDVPRIVRKLSQKNEALRDLFFKITFRRNLGWKHRMAPTAKELKNIPLDEILFLTITKNPYPWLLSLYQRPYHQQKKWKSFEQFLQSPWKTVGRENYSAPFPNPIVIWNQKNRAYLNLKNHASTYNICYEDLLECPEDIIANIVAEFPITRQKNSFENITETTKREDQGKNFDYYRQYYLGEQWKEKLDAASVEIINTYLDRDLMTKFGYETV